MHNAGAIADEAIRAAAAPVSQDAATFLFRMLHGNYGNLFFSKFATGEVIADGVDKGGDKGLVSARQVWAHRLRGFDAPTIKAALRRCEEKYIEFPPSLPQFLDLCRACAPRAQTPPPVKVGMSGELRYNYAAEVRERNRRHIEAARQVAIGHVPVPESMVGLKLAIAGAVALAGGDEAAELLRLDRMFAATKGLQ